MNLLKMIERPMRMRIGLSLNYPHVRVIVSMQLRQSLFFNLFPLL